MQLRLIACALLLSLAACVGWTGRPGMSLNEVLSREHPSTVRVTLRSDSVVVVDQPHMAGDSLSGIIKGAQSKVAVADITHVAIRGTNEFATTAIFAGIAVGIVAGLVALN